jgi:hypothetical protein
MRTAGCDCTTALMATAAGHLGCLRYLLVSRRSYAIQRNSLGQSPLHLVQHSASSTHCQGITAVLLKQFTEHARWELNATDHTGATALDLTLQQQVEHDTVPAATAAAAAAAAENTAAAATNGDAPAAVQQHSSSIFCLHCAHQLRQAGAAVTSTAQCSLLLHAALQHASLADVSTAAEFVQLLQRQQQCPIDELLRATALHCSSEQDYTAVAVLLQSGADRCAVDSQGLTVLHQVVAQGASPCVPNGRLLRLLVQCYPRPQSSSTLSDMHTELFSSRVLHAKTKSDGNTALHLAWRHPETAQTLLELGARVDELNTAGHTPLVSYDLLAAFACIVSCIVCCVKCCMTALRLDIFITVLRVSLLHGGCPAYKVAQRCKCSETETVLMRYYFASLSASCTLHNACTHSTACGVSELVALLRLRCYSSSADQPWS